MFLISRFLPSAFAGIFTDNPDYIELSVWGIRAFTLMIIPLSFQYTFVDSLTALGLTRLSLSPVSYTHLDVYKRQSYDRAEYRREKGQYRYSGLQRRVGYDHERNLHIRQNNEQSGSNTDRNDFLDAKLQFHVEFPPRSS